MKYFTNVRETTAGQEEDPVDLVVKWLEDMYDKDNFLYDFYTYKLTPFELTELASGNQKVLGIVKEKAKDFFYQEVESGILHEYCVYLSYTPFQREAIIKILELTVALGFEYGK